MKTASKKGSKNPVRKGASSRAGLRAVGNPAVAAIVAQEMIKRNGNGGTPVSRTTDEVVKQTTSVIPFLIKTVVIVGIGATIVYLTVRAFKKRFISLGENPKLQGANITKGQAMTKADVMYKAMKGFGNGFEVVRESLYGLNYNGWVRLFNAFGNRDTAIPGQDAMNLVEWLEDQFDEYELAQLRLLVGGVF